MDCEGATGSPLVELRHYGGWDRPPEMKYGNAAQKKEHLPKIAARPDPLVSGLLRTECRIGLASLQGPATRSDGGRFHHQRARRSGPPTRLRGQGSSALVRTDQSAESMTASVYYVRHGLEGPSPQAGSCDLGRSPSVLRRETFSTNGPGCPRRSCSARQSRLGRGKYMLKNGAR